ncbi:hypothetical protein SALBM311S_02327 [Streptomyces alboniger]
MVRAGIRARYSSGCARRSAVRTRLYSREKVPADAPRWASSSWRISATTRSSTFP